jgi:LysR family transcriptional regulator, benzoate and cis,cis-muconate-responsive activator of ben and cat genes
MELRHLRYFSAVARRLSFSRAARELHITQPPLSRQIKELERELGVVLFDRKTTGITLTKAGEYLKVEAQRILESVDLVARTAKMIAEPNDNVLRVGCVNFLMYSILPPFFELVKEQAPDLRLDLSIMSTEAQERALRSGAIDIGFVRSWVDDEILVFEPLSEERFAAIFPSSHVGDEDPARCIESLRDRAFIAVSPTTAPGLSEKVRSICEEYGSVPDVGYVCSDAYSIVKLVSTGLGWSIVPDFAYRDAAIAGVSLVMLPQTVLLGLGYIRRELSESERRFVELAKDFFSARSREASQQRPPPAGAAQA